MTFRAAMARSTKSAERHSTSRVPSWTVAALGCLFLSGIGRAHTLGTTPQPPNFHVTSFGSPEAYNAQTFRIPNIRAVAIPFLLEVFTGPSPDTACGTECC